MALAREAMATRFELLLWGEDEAGLRAAGEEALREIEWSDAQLSRYRPGSAVSWLNAGAGGRPVRLDARVLRLLEECRHLSEATLGAFDPTVGPLLRAWGFVGGKGRLPDPDQVEAARHLVGMERLEVRLEEGTARLAHRGMEVDLGSIGKGFALDRAMGVLEGHGVGQALLHGGTSSVHVLGLGANGGPWRIGWRVPGCSPEVEVITLEAPAFSVSAPHGKSFVHAGQTLGHVLDPRSGTPVEGRLSAAVGSASSAACDALSTALLVLGEAGVPRLRRAFPTATFRVAQAPEKASSTARATGTASIGT